MGRPGDNDLTLALQEAKLPPEAVIFGHSSAMQLVRQKVHRVAGTNVPVLVTGESGTGKEVLAKLLHYQSPWGSGPFVKVSCPAIPATLLESELFGYEKGAFTGAYGTKPGRVELADRGTLFLDEIGELDLGLQAKLLQLLQDGQFSRIGAQADKKVEVRVVCATNRQLEKEIEAGTFRSDLFYRINVVDMRLPPLRERREDIPYLIEFFHQAHCAEFNSRQVRPISPRLMKVLQGYSWPGNIRQLENLVKRYVILGNEDAIVSDLAMHSVASPPVFEPQFPTDGSVSLKDITEQAVLDVERKVILRTLQAHRWNRKQAARALNISYRALLYKIRYAGLSAPGTFGDAKRLASSTAEA
ncbi:MAG TPA: sigma-54 dependent transcriptional regulator [Terriglobia bacterium]|nr:sigma-54 dependent transcriptional regulator [Terriglobia bacterium]